MGIRTPDLLHAIQRQHVHRSVSAQVTVPGRAWESARMRTCCGTFLLYKSRSLPQRERRDSPADRRFCHAINLLFAPKLAVFLYHFGYLDASEDNGP